MLDFVRLLKRRYRSIADHTRDHLPLHSVAKSSLSSLCLSEAFLEKEDLLKRQPNLALQLAIIGPTQAGKSSVANLLLAKDQAGVSPLAGFTTFPQGFALGLSGPDRSALIHFFHDYRIIEAVREASASSRVFSLGAVSTHEHPVFRNCVIWDTPDFDSIHAANYYNSLLKTIALADVILLVLSKDKYADRTVWKLLSLIEALHQPTVIFLNKIPPQHGPAVLESLSENWRHSRTDPLPPIMAAPFFRAGIQLLNAVKEHQQLIGHLRQAMSAVDRGQHHWHCAVLLRHHWADWTEAVRQEQNLHSEWNRLVDCAQTSTLEIYQRQYLNHPQRFESLKQALAELLTLLEIPGVAPLLMKTRRLLTWPVRRLFGFGQRQSEGSGNEPRKSRESQVLERMFEHLMIELADLVFSKRSEFGDYEHWWGEIFSLLKSQHPVLSETYNQAVRGYQNEFHHEIEAAAHRLYSKLEQQPATLNSLRVTRITTDAAAVAIALKTGGIGVQDFVLTPAVLSLTSLLTESALGHYLHRVEAELKQKQLQAVTTSLFEDALTKELKSLPDRMTPNNKFKIPEQALRDAQARLHEF